MDTIPDLVAARLNYKTTKTISMTAGGKRIGAGRKTNKEKGLKKPLVTRCFRVDEDAFNKAQEAHGKALNQKVNAFIKRLSKR